MDTKLAYLGVFYYFRHHCTVQERIIYFQLAFDFVLAKQISCIVQHGMCSPHE